MIAMHLIAMHLSIWHHHAEIWRSSFAATGWSRGLLQCKSHFINISFLGTGLFFFERCSLNLDDVCICGAHQKISRAHDRSCRAHDILCGAYEIWSYDIISPKIIVLVLNITPYNSRNLYLFEKRIFNVWIFV